MSVGRQAIKTALRLGCFTLVCTLVLALVHQVSIKRIDANIEQLKTAKLTQMLPANIAYDNDLANTVLPLSADIQAAAREIGIQRIYAATYKGKIEAMVVDTVAMNGYGGKIHLLVGILANGKISAVRVVSHKETVGLGDYIETLKSSWSEQFSLVPAKTRLSIKKDGGSVTYRAGATISARAVTQSVDQVANFYQQYQSKLKVSL